VALDIDKSAELTERDWKAIASNPKFRELHRKKRNFLVGWWLFSTVFYFILPIWAGYATSQSDFFNAKIVGYVPFGYLFALSQYALCLFIALYYSHWANKVADRITRELISELRMG
jgi:uncharacterized membrane protein (DUF485 family)